MTIKVDIFISGAGPVGLFFAYQMALRGHSIYICDPKGGPTNQSRALLATSRSMEVLEARGLADEVLSEAFISSGGRIFRNGQVIGQIDACGDSAFPHMTILPQGKTEDIIAARLESETKYRVNWKTELVSYTQNDSGVISIAKNLETGEELTVESQYIIGADGSHSRARKQMPDWTYEGSAVKTRFALADLSIRGADIENMNDRMNMIMRGSHTMGMVNIMPPVHSKNKHSVFRIFWNLDSYEREENTDRVGHGLQKDTPPTIEEVQGWVNKIAHPLKFELSDLIWSAIFRINERIANGFRRKRAFVVGDAAHCHSPAGGQGMNLGLQDADNLAWKLSEVLRGTVKDPEGLLDSYYVERYPHARSTIDASGNASRVGYSDNVLFNYLRSAVISTALMVPQVRDFAFKSIMQQRVTIDPILPGFMGTSDKDLVKVGEFLPDSAALRKSYTTSNARLKTVQQRTLRELVASSNSYTAVFVATCPASIKPNKVLIEKFWKSTEDYPIKRYIIQSAYHGRFMRQLPDYVSDNYAAEESFYNEVQFDSHTSVTQRIGLHSHVLSMRSSTVPCALLVVRPDLYVAQAKLINNEKELEESLKFVASLFV